MTVAPHRESRPGQATGTASDFRRTRTPDTTVPAPVDGGLAMLHGPLMHPDSAPAIWREYGRPPAPPWGSYLDTTPLPRHRDRRGPFEVAMDAAQQHGAQQRGGMIP